ncbi:hypothetical protein LV84_01499 [Algoriphagus ratkowskyi]|uniref:Uncharacterized protein n=1 Tax=Algoriphagus ratkowskyi TaxID=57028 RepID=A0A2W7S5X9_9BACT|nr:hypothetical protein LV84_01499 [Algoriphagus ratkowskyi]
MLNTGNEATSVTRHRSSSLLSKENNGTGRIADNHILVYPFYKLDLFMILLDHESPD